MKKRIRIIFLILTFCLCLSLMPVAIYAAASIVVNISSSLNYDLPVAIDIVKWNSINNYYYIEMGKLSDGTPLEWRLVLERTGSEENPLDSTVNGIVNSNFTGNKAELEGKTYYFLLNTWTGGTNYLKASEACALDNNFLSNGYSRDYDDHDVAANDYASSTIRFYITGTPVLRGSNGSDDLGYTPVAHSGSNQTGPEDFLSKYKIEEDPVYSLIKPRTLADLYTKMSSKYEELTDIRYNNNVALGYGDTQGIPSSTEDKLWILSRYEAIKISGDETASDLRAWNETYWLRSPWDNTINCNMIVWEDGEVDHVSKISVTYCARPAFQMVF